MPECEQSLVPNLTERLGLNNVPQNDHEIILLMTEDPEREAQQQRLIERVKRLTDGHAFISESLNGADAIPVTPRTGMKVLPDTDSLFLSSRKRYVEGIEEEDESPSKKIRPQRLSQLATRAKSEVAERE